MFVKQLPEQKPYPGGMLGGWGFFHIWTLSDISTCTDLSSDFFADMELSSFEVDDEEKFFESHLQTITVSLVGCIQDSTPTQPHISVPSSSHPMWTVPIDQAAPREVPQSIVGGSKKEWSVEPKSLLLSPADGGEYVCKMCGVHYR